jgi:hypothetical protein
VLPPILNSVNDLPSFFDLDLVGSIYRKAVQLEREGGCKKVKSKRVFFTINNLLGGTNCVDLTVLYFMFY